MRHVALRAQGHNFLDVICPLESMYALLIEVLTQPLREEWR